MDDPNFAYDLLTELTRTFLAYADNVRAQDSAAYAIQVPTFPSSSLYKYSIIKTFLYYYFFCILSVTRLCACWDVLCRNCCLYLSVVKEEPTHQAAVCGGDSQNRFKKSWSHTSTAGNPLPYSYFCCSFNLVHLSLMLSLESEYSFKAVFSGWHQKGRHSQLLIGLWFYVASAVLQ